MKGLSKNAVRVLLFAVIALICFNVIAFVIPVPKNGTFWVSYLFGMLAIALQLVVMRVAFKGKESVRSRFYGFPVARIGIVYGICQILLSVTAMALSKYVPFWIPLCVFILMLSAGVAGLIAADAVRDTIEEQDIKTEKEVSMMRNLQSKMNLLLSQTECRGELKASLSALTEEIRFSDPVSSKATETIEQELYFHIEELQKAVVDEDEASALTICKKAKGILAERNRVCKLTKNQK